MNLFQFVRKGYGKIMTILYHYQFNQIHKTARIHYTVDVYNSDNLIMAEHTNIDAGATIMNGRAKFVMKKWSGAAIKLIVVTGNHMSVPGVNGRHVTNSMKDKIDVNHEFDKDVVVEEGVWIASNVTLLSGVTLGRGCEVGAGSVVRKSTPPYSVVVGNPAKVVGFRFSPEEVIEHELAIYPEEERIPLDTLERNYQKYYLNRIAEIKSFLKH